MGCRFFLPRVLLVLFIFFYRSDICQLTGISPHLISSRLAKKKNNRDHLDDGILCLHVDMSWRVYKIYCKVFLSYTEYKNIHNILCSWHNNSFQVSSAVSKCILPKPGSRRCILNTKRILNCMPYTLFAALIIQLIRDLILASMYNVHSRRFSS